MVKVLAARPVVGPRPIVSVTRRVTLPSQNRHSLTVQPPQKDFNSSRIGLDGPATA